MVEEKENQEVEEKMESEAVKSRDPYKKTAIIVGILFITATVAYSIGIFLLDPLLTDSNYLAKISENENIVIMGALFVLIDAVAVAGIGVTIYPILKKDNETFALAYAGARIAEGILFVVNVLFILTLLSLSQEYVKEGAPGNPYYHTLGTVLLAAGDWAFLLGFGVAFTISALILNYVLYRSKLVPSWLALWGFVGAALLWVNYLLQYFSVGFAQILLLPIAIQEMVFAVWLIRKGFDLSKINSKEEQTT